MKGKRDTEAQITCALRQAEAGYGISNRTRPHPPASGDTRRFTRLDNAPSAVILRTQVTPSSRRAAVPDSRRATRVHQTGAR